MKLRHIPRETLLDMRNTDKVFAFARYINESNAPIAFENIFRIDSTTDDIQKVELFEKDLNKTADMIFKTLEVVLMADSDGNVEALKSKDKNLVSIFGDSYDPKRKSITIAGIEMSTLNISTKDDIKDKILSKNMGISGNQYKDLRKTFKALERAERSDKSSPEYDADNDLKYLAAAAGVEKHNGFIKKIDELAKVFTEYRNEISRSDKTLIDTSITFTRGMIDSVIKSSTYVNQDGIDQISPAHNKDAIKLKKIAIAIKDSRNVDSIEIDQDASLDAVLELIENVNSIELNIQDKICLKIRKLGNYGANGMFVQSGNIVAIDPKLGQHSTIHELVHASDIGNLQKLTPIEFDKRNSYIRIMTDRLDRNHPSIKSNLEYLTNPLEVVARAGEIAYLLKKYDHQNGESMKSFSERVKSAESENNGRSGLSKPMESYERNAAIYFNFQDMGESHLELLKSFSQTQFSVELGFKPSSKNLNDLKIEVVGSKPETTKVPRRHSKYSAAKNPYRNFDSENISFIFEANKRMGIMPTEELAMRVIENISLLTRSKQSISLNDVKEQFNTIEAAGEWLKNNATDSEKITILRESLPLSFHYHPSETSSTAIAMNNSTNSYEMSKSFELLKQIRETYYLKSQYQGQVFSTIQNSLKMMMEGSDLKLDDLAETLTNTDPITIELIENSGVRRSIMNIMPNGGSEPNELNTFDFYRAAMIAGAKDNVQNLRDALENMVNGGEMTVFKLKKEASEYVSNLPRSLKAGNYNYGRPMSYDAVKMIKGKGDNSDFFEFSGKNQSPLMPDTIFAHLSTKKPDSMKKMLDDLNGVIPTVIIEIDKASKQYQFIVENKKIQESKVEITAEIKEVVKKPEVNSITDLMVKKATASKPEAPIQEIERSKTGDQLKFSF